MRRPPQPEMISDEDKRYGDGVPNYEPDDGKMLVRDEVLMRICFDGVYSKDKIKEIREWLRIWRKP